MWGLVKWSGDRFDSRLGGWDGCGGEYHPLWWCEQDGPVVPEGV